MTNMQAIRLMPTEAIAEVLVKIYNEQTNILNDEIFKDECDSCKYHNEDIGCTAQYGEDCPTSEFDKALNWLNKEIE